MFTVGTLDPLLDDTLFMEARWRAAGHATELHVWPEAPHGFLSLPMSVTSPALDAEHEFLRRTLRLDEAAADRVARQLDAVVHAELLEDVRAVALDGLLADHQRVGDLPGAVALGDQLDDLLLARGERLLAQRLIGPGALAGSPGSAASSPPGTGTARRASPPGRPRRGRGRRPS